MTVRLIVLGVASFLVFLVGTAPASLVTQSLVDEVPGVALDGVGGTLWSGHARTVTWFGRSVGDVEWSLAPGTLMAGTAAVRLTVTGPELALDARVDRGLWSGRTAISEVRGHASFAAIQRLSGARGPISGRADIMGVALTLDDDRPVALSGRVVLKDVVVAAPSPQPIGSFILDLGMDEGRLHATVADDSSAVAATGGVRLDPDGRWNVDLQVRARVPDSAIASALEALGPPDPSGFRRLEVSGGP